MEHKEANIFIIGNSSQYIYLAEAIDYFSLQNEPKILIISSFHKDYINQTEKLCKSFYWDKIIKTPTTISFLWKINMFTRIFAFIFMKIYYNHFAKKHSSNSRVFIGNIQDPWMQHIANGLKQENIIAMDDGNATLTFFEKINSKINNSIKDRKSKLLSLNSLKINNLTFFTIYHDCINIPKGFSIISNHLHYIKKTLRNIETDERLIYILGSPFIKLGMLSEEKYLTALRCIISKNKGKTIIYIKHRAEDFFQIEDITVKSLDLPIELYLQQSNYLPKKIVNFFSSAAVTISRIYGERIILENIPLTKINPYLTDYYNLKEADSFIISKD